MKIGLFYGSTTCYTEMAAEKIRALIGPELVDIHNIKDVSLRLMEDYEILILGISTGFWRTAGGLGVPLGRYRRPPSGGTHRGPVWPRRSARLWRMVPDALGMLHDQLVPKGVKLVGYWPNEGYEFDASKALIDDGRHFVGLALDDANQYDQTDPRIEQWVEQILSEIHALL